MSREQLLERIERLECELREVNRELDDTNKGVVALYGELDERARQLIDAVEVKGRFLSYMSHEFRTPLNSIVSLTRILQEGYDGPLTEEQNKQVGFIATCAGELTEIVNDLLDLAKLEAGRLTVSPEWFDMVDLFGALRGMFRPLVAQTGLNLVFESSTNIPSIFSDHKKLRQILRNFISNALKFTEEGEIRVVASLESEELVRFSVIDTGIGIPSDALSNIFEDFVQIDNLIQKRHRGTGLGLALCKQMAELLGGTIGVHSVLGQGSTFFTCLPTRYQGSGSTST